MAFRFFNYMYIKIKNWLNIVWTFGKFFVLPVFEDLKIIDCTRVKLGKILISNGLIELSQGAIFFYFYHHST